MGSTAEAGRPMSLERYLSRAIRLKVPQITVIFWVIKLLSTAMGESFSDYLVFHVDPYVAVIVGGLGLVVALVLQLRARRYVPWIYWFAVSMVAVFGTMAADVLHVVLGIPYFVSSTFFALSLMVIFIVWYFVERNLSIHSVDTPRRELFYWATVMATFALGTALGDLTAATFGLGYFASGVLFAVLFAIPALAYRWFGLNEIAAFWAAYIVTRPLGASFADWSGKSALGGLGWGDARVSLVLILLILAFVGYLTMTNREVRTSDTPPLDGIEDDLGTVRP